MPSKKKPARPSTPAGAPRAGVTLERVVDVAAALADAEGLAAVTLARLASELGVKTPSLYAHIDSLEHVHRRLKLRGLTEMLDKMRRRAVGRAGKDALLALADAQRDYAREHPGLYAETARLAPGDGPEIEAAARETIEVVGAVLHGYGLDGDEALHATRALRATTRGFIDLELAGGFGMPLQVDESWRRLLTILDEGLRRSKTPASSA